LAEEHAISMPSSQYLADRDGRMIRLRQVVLVARDRDAVVAELCDRLGVTVCFEDPGVAEFGLHNALMTIGDQFLEVVSPVEGSTTAGRLLDKRGGDGGYMAIFEVDDLDRRLEVLKRAQVRTVFRIELADIRARHLHPSDVGGTLVSIDQPDPPGSWRWGGPWEAHTDTDVVTAIAGVEIGAADPDSMSERWARLELDRSVRFVHAGSRGDGLDAIELVAADRGRIGDSTTIGGVELRLV